MILQILSLSATTDFDIRNFIDPTDEMAYQSDQWISDYKLKNAICKILKPDTILEVGVRYGYNAVTFLSAVQKTRYIGIYDVTNAREVSHHDIRWAKKITERYKLDFLLLNTQIIEEYPGKFFDFIHISGQRKGDETIHQLEMALEKGKWILLEGFFGSKENLFSSAFFLEKYRNFIEFSIIIPSSCGLLLIKTNLSAREVFSKFKDRGYKNIQNSYNNRYFLTDCGGYDLFKKSKGNSLEDPRLLAAYYLANPKTGQKILDIGCGRGELAFALAKAGAEVTGIDYSESAISIAKDMFCDGNNSLPNLKYFNDDFLQMQFDSKFDVIIAMDLIEHIEQENLGVFLKKISTLLKINGFFIVHTAPNLLYYLYKYETNRKLVHEAGWFLPKNPRSYYEDLMHINEQTPGSIQESLTTHFENVLVWTTTLPDNLGSLCRSFSQEELIDARDIFAVASHSPIEKEILIFRLSQQKLNPAYLSVEISSKTTSVRCTADDVFFINIAVKNRSRERFVSLDPYPINISYHWMDKEEHYMKFGLERTSIKIPLEPSEKQEFTLHIKAPDIPGCYILQITLVQESNFWFEHLLKNLPFSIDVEVI